MVIQMINQHNIEEITRNIISLPKKERLEIARFILFLDNHSSDLDVESAWENEIIQRANSVKDGTAKGFDFFKSMNSLERRYIEK